MTLASRRLTRPMLAALAALLISTAAAPAPAVATPPGAVAQSGPSTVDDRPNIILIVMDDQRWDTMDSMPWLRRYARQNGATFAQAYAPLPQCCPARTSILTGLYPHNHNVWKSAPSTKPGALGGHTGMSLLESATIATWLDDAGYTTSLIGKYANGYPAYPDEGLWSTPPGWDEWAGIFRAGRLDEPIDDDPDFGSFSADVTGYLKYTIGFGADGAITHVDSYYASQSTLYRHYPGLAQPDAVPLDGNVHSTLTYGKIARNAVRDHAQEPFFLWLNFTAPHMGAIPTGSSADLDVPMVDRTQNGYTENFATDEELAAAGKPAWVRDLPPMDSYTCAEAYSAGYKCADAASSLAMERDQRRTLIDADREIRKLFKTLNNTVDENGRPLIETTYVVFTSDHGFMWGEHRIPHNKGVPYEESIAIPFIVFGPDVEPGKLPVTVSLVDVAPTFLDWAHVDRRAVEASSHPLDGESLAALVSGAVDPRTFRNEIRAGVLAESHSRTGDYFPEEMRMPAWQAIATPRWKVIRYKKGHPSVLNDPYGISVEMYDLNEDPYELQSLADPDSLSPGGLRRAWRYLKRLKTCSGNTGETSCSIPASARR